MKHWIIFSLSLFLLAACSQSSPTPSEADIQTAIAQTQAANPTSTNSPEPTKTLTPTATPTETPTATPTNTPNSNRFAHSYAFPNTDTGFTNNQRRP